MGRRLLRVKPQGCVEVSDSTVVLTFIPEAIAPHTMGVGVVGVETDGLGKVCERLVQCILFNVGLCPVVVGQSFLGSDSDL